MLSENSIER